MKKGKFIEVYDNILPIELVNDIEQKVLYDIDYFYKRNITHNELDEYSPGFTKTFIDREINLTSPLSPYLNQILYRLCSYLNINLYEIFNGRIFLQLPLEKDNTPSNNIHTDRDIPHLVCLYYVTDSDGDTILYEDDEKTEIKRVTPKKGRIVFFDGSIKHCSSHPSKSHRAIVNFDFVGKYLDKQE